ncbi:MULTISPECIES: response regulator transcription factor [unclassified Nodularia (in: cyanobacteria)]|uniref:response regulator transcription factor n=1 Tax=unclassified Nodularia (in: cyanobacteria) TaxID=2656917 RepID=UPI0018804B8A|nr:MULTISPECIES: response regulator transcription factor [unclassified Nodularia (in: cyanobacteria)]MBE9198878.1 response regulator transcription factor [Nodularia sp. LEGE 06071]MCC2695414.1 response regulator transcription factor [Nodularia sp. LEGE 04288]
MSQQIVVIDFHEVCISGTIAMLKAQYSEANMITATTAQEAFEQVLNIQPDLIITDIFLPEKPGVSAQISTGIQLLQTLMKNFPHLNIMVQSDYINNLIQIKSEIYQHQGGFILADKSLPQSEMLHRVKLSFQGLTHIKDVQGIYHEIEVKPVWLKLLNLAFQEGLQDRAIAQNICVSERMVRHYWDGLQNALNIDCEELKNQGKNLRIITQIRARELGLIN